MSGRTLWGTLVPMSREIPEVVRAAAGLAATVLDEARKLPETLPGLPVRILGLAMQHAMKVQQQYAGLVARGDELFTGLGGENEPGLATFDDDVEPVTITAPGFRDSKFDRADDVLTEAEVEELPADPAADAVVAVIDELADQVEEGRQSIEDLVEESPGTADILDEIAIDELVDQAPTLEETAPGSPALSLAGPAEDAAVTQDAAPSADVPTTVDVLTPAGEVATVDATVTDEGVAAVEAPAPDTAEVDAAVGSAVSGSQAPGTAPGNAPIDGYDSFSIAQLRGRLRGYALSTVQDLVAYEEATRARGPYLKMLRNRLERIEEQAVESSPLAPRGA